MGTKFQLVANTRDSFAEHQKYNLTMSKYCHCSKSKTGLCITTM